MIIPHDRLTPRTLRSLIEDFVTREGTDNGYARKSLEADVQSVMAQLERGEAVIVYDPRDHTAFIKSIGDQS